MSVCLSVSLSRAFETTVQNFETTVAMLMIFFQSDTEGGVRVGPILETLPLTYFSEDIALARLASSLSRK